MTDNNKQNTSIFDKNDNFYSLYSNSPFGVLICSLIRDENGNAIDFIHKEGNQSIEKQTGFKLIDLVGKKASEIVDEKVFLELLTKYEGVVNTGETINYTQYFAIYDRTLDVRVYLLHGDLFILNFIDVSTRTKAETHLRDSEEKYRSIVEGSLQGMVIAQNDPVRISFASSPMEKISGYSPNEIESFNPKELMELIHEDDRATFFSNFSGRIEGRDVEPNKKYRLIHKKGSIRWVELFSTVVQYNGEPAVQAAFIDITERKKAEEELRKSEIFLQSIINNIGDPVFVKDDQHRVTLINDAFCSLFGLSKTEIIGKTLAENLPPDEMEHFMRVDKQVLKDGQDNLCEEPLTVKGKQTLTISTKKTRFIDNDGNKYIIGTIRDITDRKKAEDDIKAKSLFLESLIEQSPLPTFVLDSKGFTVMANEAFLKFYAVPDKNFLIGKNALEDPSNISQGVVKYFKEALSGKVVEMPEVEFVAPYNNKRAFTKCKLFPIFDPKGTLTNIVAMQEDITDSKDAVTALLESQKRYKKAQAMGHVGNWEYDPLTTIFWASDEAKKIYGFNVETKDFSTERVESCIPERERVHQALIDLIDQDKEYDLVFDIITADKGIRKTIHSVAELDRDDQGNPIKITGVISDITEKKNLQDAMQRSQKLESLGILAGGIAHDFNNILSAIFGFTELAVMKSTENKISGYLDKSLSNIERARALTQQLLTFSKGGTPVKKVEKLFPFVQDTVRFALSGSSVSSKFMIDDNLWACNIDKNQIGQVVDNLTINAQQAMPNGGTINIQAKNISLSEKEHPSLVAGNYVKLSIQDQGIGIPKEFLSRIFDPYFTTKSKGHGLGLSTCYSIINRHGGSIDVDSEPGKGCTFNIYIPATTEDVSTIEERSAKRHLGSGTFLVMDDDKAILDLMVEMIESLGYNVVPMTNGTDAIDFFKAEYNAGRKVAGMIFDLTIPGGMGGKETIKEIRKICLETPVFVSSGYSEDPILANPQDHGFNASIRKPFMMTDLSEMLEKHLKRS